MFSAPVFKSILCIFQLWSTPASILICWNDKQCSRVWNNEGPSVGLISPAQVHPCSRIASCEAGVVGETRGRGIKVIRHLILRSAWGFFINLFSSWGLVFAAVGLSRGWIGFPLPPFFWFFLKGCVTGQFSQRKTMEPSQPTDSCGSSTTPCLDVNRVMAGCISCW